MLIARDLHEGGGQREDGGLLVEEDKREGLEVTVRTIQQVRRTHAALGKIAEQRAQRGLNGMRKIGFQVSPAR